MAVDRFYLNQFALMHIVSFYRNEVMLLEDLFSIFRAVSNLRDNNQRHSIFLLSF